MKAVDSTSEVNSIERRFRFRYAVRTDVGMKRKENQDSYGIAETSETSLFIVADGMGGAQGGAQASCSAVNIVSRAVFDGEGQVSPQSVETALAQANSYIFEESRTDEDLAGMGTTIVVLAFAGEKAMVAHVGDSRIYFYRNGEIIQLTRDHTLVQDLIDSGAITPEQAENHPISHMLTRSLGPTSAIQPDIAILDCELQEGDRFLLCCDGLFNHLSDQEIAEMLKHESLEESVEEMVVTANRKGGSDNITVEVVEVCKVDAEELEPLPASKKIVVSVSGELDSFDEKAFLSGLDESVKKLHDNVALSDEERSSIIASLYQTNGAGQEVAVAEEKQEEQAANEEVAAEQSQEPEKEPVVETAAEPDRAKDTEEEKEAEPETPEVDEEVEEEAELEAESDEELDLEYDSEPEDVAAAVAETAKPPVPQAIVALFIIAAFFVGGAFFNMGELGAKVFGKKEEKISKTKSELEDELFQSETPKPEITPKETTSPIKPEETKLPDLPEPEIEIPEATKVVEDEPVEAPSDSDNNVVDQNVTDAKVTDEKVTEILKPSSLDPAESEEKELVATQPPPEVKETVSADKLAMNELVIKAQESALVEATKAKATEPGPDKPINWDKEKELVEDIKQTPAPIEVAPQPGKALTPIEQRKLILKKSRAREEIAKIETKLLANSIADKAGIQAKIKETEKELAKLDSSIEEETNKFETSKRKRALWLKRQDKLLALDPISLAGELANTDEFVREAKEFYEISDSEHKELVKSWRSNPSDVALASQIAAKQSDLKARKAELIKAIRTTLSVNLEQAEVEISEQGVVLDDLKTKRKILNRSVGLLQASRASSEEAKTKENAELAEKKKKLLDELAELQASLSDSQELQVRKSLILKKLGLQ